LPSGPEGLSVFGDLGPTASLQRDVSDRGQVFFDTSEALLPGDTNGKLDVYEYEGGQLYLISSGTSGTSDLFLDASPSGGDVFFASAQGLGPQDGDGAVDVYDARVSGGLPGPLVAQPCVGDACRDTTAAAPSPPTAATLMFFGPGNTTRGAQAIRVGIASKKVLKGFRFSVVMTVPEEGKITIKGRHLITATKSVRRAGTYRLIVRLTARERKALVRKHKRKLTLTVHVQYSPARGGLSTSTFHLTMNG
jgi:hypothetical protein